MTQEIRESTVHGTVAEGFEAVREEFTAVVAEQPPEYEGQLTALVHGRRVVDLWAGPDTDGDTLYGVFSHSVGFDLVARAHKAFGLGFQATAENWYPFLGAGAFGHSGAGGTQASADPRSGLAYGYTRRRMAFPAGAAPENVRLVRAAHTAAPAS